MAYRGDDAGDVLEARTGEGLLRLTTGPTTVTLSVGTHTLQLGERFATLVEDGRKKSTQTQLARDGKLYIARGVPRDDLGVWLELPEDDKGAPAGIRRIFGVTPLRLFSDDSLQALKGLDAIHARLRIAVGELGGWAGRAIEVGAGHPLDKVLLAETGDHHAVYARGLFRDRARFAMAVHPDGRIAVTDKKGVVTEVVVRSRHGITVWGDYIRFADKTGKDIAWVAIPWLAPEDRHELARRIGQLVDRDHDAGRA